MEKVKGVKKQVNKPQKKYVVTYNQQNQINKRPIYGNKPNLTYKSITDDELVEIYKERYIPVNEITSEEVVEIKKKFMEQDKKKAFSKRKDPVDLQLEIDSIVCKRVRQRTPLWKNIRAPEDDFIGDIRIGSSDISTILGFWAPFARKYMGGYCRNKDYTEIYQTVLFMKRKDKKFDAASQTNMGWGTNHENNAVSHFLRTFEECKFYEPTCNIIKRTEEYPFSVVVSPDGCFEDVNNPNNSGTIEIKCPSPFYPIKETDSRLSNEIDKTGFYGFKNVEPYKDVIPWYYLLQIHYQMYSSGKKKGVFICWTPTKGVRYVGLELDEELIKKSQQTIRWFIGTYVSSNRIIRAEDFKINPYENYQPYKNLLDHLKKLRNPKYYQIIVKDNYEDFSTGSFFK